ncbi:MAG: hypothetical protein Q8N36_06065 [bacterium]|nr:hypothetical protein [bacterium]
MKSVKYTVVLLVVMAFIMGMALPMAASSTLPQKENKSLPAPQLRIPLVISQVAKVPVAQVLAKKTSDNTWEAVAAHFGVSWEKVKEQLQEAKKDNKPILEIVKLLARLSGKTPQEVIALKTKDNTWQQVATSLGIDSAKLQKELASKPHQLVAIIAKLAKLTPAQVLELKKDKTWEQVLASLNITKKQVHEAWVQWMQANKSK